MPLPIKSNDHVLRALGRLIQQYQKPGIEAWVSSFLVEVQEFEDALWSVLEGVYLDNAEGVTLDMLGEIVKEERLGRGDVGYLLGIKTRIRINRSYGRARDILEVSRIMVGPAYPAIEISDVQPATIKLSFPSILGTLFGAELFRALVQTKAAGVRLFVFESFGAENSFTFNDAAKTLGSSAALGFSSVNDAGAGTGGVLSHVWVVSKDTPAWVLPVQPGYIVVDESGFIQVDGDGFIEVT